VDVDVDVDVDADWGTAMEKLGWRVLLI